MVLTGLRGVGKTVLLNTFRSMALQRLWGTGKIEARPGQSIRRPVAAALLALAVRELAPRHRASRPGRSTSSACSRRSRSTTRRPPRAARSRSGWASTSQAQRGRADSGDLEVDLTELFAEAASVAADLGVGIALFVDEMQDVPADDVSALCAACHELSQTGGRLIVVRPAAPAVRAVGEQELLERLFKYTRIDRLDREAADLALIAPAQREDVTFTPGALDALYAAAMLQPAGDLFLVAPAQCKELQRLGQQEEHDDRNHERRNCAKVRKRRARCSGE